MIICLIMAEFFMVAFVCIMTETSIDCNPHEENPRIYYKHSECMRLAPAKLDDIVLQYKEAGIPVIQAQLYCVKGSDTI
tara:strand:- start:190 stop:426 length:237 start_codon:yes stop_codon:yes gene_type:complete